MTHSPSPSASRTFIVAGFVLSTLFTAALSTVGGVYLAHRQAVMNEQLQRVDAFSKISGEFPGLVREYSTQLIERNDHQKQLKRLQDNIVHQQTILNDAENGLSEEELSRSNAYKKTLSDLQDLLEGVESADDSGPILQPLADAVDQREIVVADLRKSAGLKAKAQPLSQ